MTWRVPQYFAESPIDLLPHLLLNFNRSVYFTTLKMAHLITGNKFDPNKDIPDLSGKVRPELPEACT